MHYTKMATMALSALALAGLTACGGGGSDAGSQPTVRTGQSITTTATNTLQVEAGGTTALPNGSYRVDTAYSLASGTVQMSGYVLEFVSPESNSFDAGLAFAQNNVNKFIIGLYEERPSEVGYYCLSVAWTPAELAELAVLFNEPDIANVQKCPTSGVVIDGTTHRASFSHLRLASTDDANKFLTFSADLGWALQRGTLGGGLGGGSGSGTGTPISSSGSVSLGGIGGITVTGPTAVTPVGLQEASGAH